MLTCQSDLFSLPSDLHYLNCAYMAPLPRPVEEAGISGIRRKRNPTVIQPEHFFEDSGRIRRLFGRLVNADPDSVAIVPSASYGLATIAANLQIRRGDRIVVLEEQFPSNVYIWRRAAKDAEAAIVTVGPGTGIERRAARWNERLLEAIDDRTSVVAMPHVHWTDGTLFDVEAVSRRAREVGAALVVDGTQSVGALPFDVQRIRPDALICAGYKWLMGPYGLGVTYFAERHHDGRPLEENWIGRLRSEAFSGLVDYEDRYQPGAVRYDVGERSNFILVPMLAAALEMVISWDPAAIQEYCRRLVDPLIERAGELGLRVEEPSGRGHHLFGLRSSAGVDTDVLRRALEAHRVSVSVRGSAVRVAPHVYNDEHDVQALIDALESVVAAAT